MMTKYDKNMTKICQKKQSELVIDPAACFPKTFYEDDDDITTHLQSVRQMLISRADTRPEIIICKTDSKDTQQQSQSMTT
jgi:menaquinone-dependent protoporphyrinogen IX oxidase